MSRNAQLPPRCPFQKKSLTRPIHDAVSPNSCKDIVLHPRYQKSISQSSIVEDQPAWLDDLLSDSDTKTKGIIHRRSASDSVTLLDSFAPLNNDDSSVSSETGSALESSSMYGPNSPRRKGKLAFPENEMVSALSEYLSQRPMQYLDGGLCVSGMLQCDLVQDTSGSAGEGSIEAKAAKRYSGQRSRVRKLQYIAELERTVEVFQTMESELAVRVASLLQQRASLSMENSTLKQQVAGLKKEKLIMDGQYRSLKTELGRLKSSLAYLSNKNVSTDFRSSSTAEGVSVDAVWQMLDMGKLDLN